MSIVLSDIGKLIRSERKKHNLTIKQLADKLDVTMRAIIYWEQGEKLPSLATVDKLMEIFSLKITIK